MWFLRNRKTVRVAGIIVALIALVSMLITPVNNESDSLFDFSRGLAFGLGLGAVLLSFIKPKTLE